jgi:hypothetical protein
MRRWLSPENLQEHETVDLHLARKGVSRAGTAALCLILLLLGLVVVYFLITAPQSGSTSARWAATVMWRKSSVSTSKRPAVRRLDQRDPGGHLLRTAAELRGQTTVKTGLTSINMIFQPLAIYLLAQIIRERINIIICVPICAFTPYSIFNLLTMLGVPSARSRRRFSAPSSFYSASSAPGV